MRENQVILLGITNGKKQHHLAGKSASITQWNNIKSSCLNCFHSYSTKNKLKEHERICNDHDYCYVKIPNEDSKILKYNQGEKSLKAPAIIYADLECLLEKMHSCQNNLEESYKEKKTKHTPSGYPLFTSDVKFVF